MAFKINILRSAPVALDLETRVLQATAQFGHRFAAAVAGGGAWDPESPWALVLMAAAAFLALDWLSGTVSSLVSPLYRRLTPARQALWNNRIVSVVHAIVVAAGATRVLWHEPDAQQAFLYRYSPAGTVYLALFGGYSLYDLVVIIHRYFFGDRATSSKAMFIHHAVSLMAVSLPLWAGHFTYPAMSFLINEWSTPLLHLRYFMGDLGIRKDSRAYVFNQYAFALLFLVCRVLLNLWLFGQIVHHVYLDERDAFIMTGQTLVAAAGTALAGAFVVINLYWFILITRRGSQDRPAKVADGVDRKSDQPPWSTKPTLHDGHRKRD